MRSVYEEAIGGAREINRQLSTGADKIVGPSKFGAVAKVLWPPPLSPAAEVAAIAKSSTRTAERWLAGEIEPPFCVIHAVMGLIFKRP